MDFQLYHRFLVQKESKWLKFFWDVSLAEWPKKCLLAVKAILDFIYLSQYPSHNTATLQYMAEALNQFDANTHRGTTLYRMVPFKERIQCTE